MYTLLVALVIAPDVDRLGHDVWGVRECAEERLRTLGFIAWPELVRAAESEDAEVRHRACRLLVPYKRFMDDLHAANYLADPWPLTARQAACLFVNDDLRCRLHRLALASGCDKDRTHYLLPDNTLPSPWWGYPPAVLMAGSLQSVRTQLGCPPVGWPFRQP